MVEKGVYGIVYFGSNFLLIRRKDNGLWEFPGGSLEEGEDGIKGIKREVKEETGLDVDVSVGFRKNLKYAGKRVFVHYGICTLKDIGSIFSIKLDDEHDSYAWVDIRDLQKIKTASVRGAMEMINNLYHYDLPFKFVKMLKKYRVKGVKSAGYTGSLARGDFLPYYSDIDLFVYYNKNIEIDKLKRIMNMLDKKSLCQLSLHIDCIRTENRVHGYLDLLEQKYSRIYLYRNYRHKYNVMENGKKIRRTAYEKILRLIMLFRYYYCLIRKGNNEIGSIHCFLDRSSPDYERLLLGKLYEITGDLVRTIAMFLSRRYVHNMYEALMVIGNKSVINEVLTDRNAWPFRQFTLNYKPLLKNLVRFYVSVKKEFEDRV